VPNYRTGSYAALPQLAPDEALHRLVEGNGRFASNVRSVDSMVSHLRRAELVAGQRPFAVIIGCSDSRAPAEIVFDQGLGDLFVIRVAGPVMEPSQIGSVEFACAHFGVPLVMVLGHSHCGAIAATIAEILNPDAGQSRHVLSIVNKIRPAVSELVLRHRHDPKPELFEVAVKANVKACMEQLRQGSTLVEARIASGELKLVGGEYEIESGRIDFVDP
jgi:carbonic anhydrase